MPSSTRVSEKVDLLVVGAGPVGLFAALCAARSGLKVMVLDQVWRGYGQGYASLLHSTTLDLLEGGGFADALRARGRSLERVQLQVDDAPTISLDLPAPALAVSQAVLEQVLLDGLRAQGVPVRVPYQAATLEQGPDHVDVRVLRRELVTLGAPAHYSEWEPVDSSIVRAAFVIGADGYESRVRSALGIEMIEISPAQSFAMFESGTQAENAPVFRLGLQGELARVAYPIAGERRRWGFQIDRGLDAPADSTRLNELLVEWAAAMPPLAGSELIREQREHVDWGTVIHFERRLCRRFGKGRVWLAGDAAHVTSPFGAQSMNLGFAEANELVERIIRNLRAGGPGALEEYGIERTREWHKLLGVNVSFELLPRAPSWVSTHVRRLAPALPASRNALAEVLKQLGVRLT
jgi:2-polyprenyl-6-methoxyphenol hydroxylase-like FAD-dependent oxidoreductase